MQHTAHSTAAGPATGNSSLFEQCAKHQRLAKNNNKQQRQTTMRHRIPLLLYLLTTTQAASWEDITSLNTCVEKVLENTGNLWRYEWANIVYDAACEDQNYPTEQCNTLITAKHVKWSTLPDAVQEEFCDEACDIDDADCDENSCNEDGSDRVILSSVTEEEADDIATNLCDNAADHWTDIIETLVDVYNEVIGDDNDNDDTATTICTDVTDWTDAFGDDCAEYESQNWCAEHSECCPNEGTGLSSGAACCVCGGGVSSTASTPAPSSGSGAAPSAAPVSDVLCTDVTSWADSFGDNCTLYEQRGWCEEYGDCCPNEGTGLSSGAACCACGGGVRPMPSPAPSVAKLASEGSFNVEFGFGVIVEGSYTAVQVLEDGVGDAILDHLYTLTSGVLANLGRRRLQSAQLVGIQYTGVTVKKDCPTDTAAAAAADDTATTATITCMDMTTRITLQSDGTMSNDDVSTTVRTALTDGQTEGMYYANDVPGLTSTAAPALDTNNATNNNNNNNEMSRGNVLYIILAVVIAVSITCLILFYLHRRSKSKFQNACGSSRNREEDGALYDAHIDTHLTKQYNGNASDLGSVQIAQSVGHSEDPYDANANMEVTIDAADYTAANGMHTSRAVTPDRMSVGSGTRSVGSPSTVGLNSYTPEYGIGATQPQPRSPPSAAMRLNSSKALSSSSPPSQRRSPRGYSGGPCVVVPTGKLVDTDVTLNESALPGTPSANIAKSPVKVKRSVSWADPQLMQQQQQQPPQSAFGGDWGRAPSPSSTIEQGGSDVDSPGYNSLSPNSDDGESDLVTTPSPTLQQTSSFTDQAMMALSSMVATDDLCRVISDQVQNLAGAPLSGAAGTNHSEEDLDECDTWMTQDDGDTVTTAPSLGEYRRSGGLAKGGIAGSNYTLNYDAMHNPVVSSSSSKAAHYTPASLSIPLSSPLPSPSSNTTNALPSLKEEVGSSDEEEQDLDNDSLLADSITGSPSASLSMHRQMQVPKSMPMGREHSTLTQHTNKTSNTAGTAQMSNTRNAVKKRNTSNDMLNISGLSAVPEDDVSVDVVKDQTKGSAAAIATPFDEGGAYEDFGDESDDDLGSLGELSSLGGGSSVNVYVPPPPRQASRSSQVQAQSNVNVNGEDSKSEFNDWLKGEIDTLKQAGSWTKIEKLIESTDGDTAEGAAGEENKQRSHYHRPISPTTYGKNQNNNWEDSSSSEGNSASSEEGDMLPSLPVVRKMYT